MMDKDKLRKADIFSGSAIIALGVYIAAQALKMPMKDSWGGVQNVWYVSPAIFPLFVGAVIALLGGLLVRTAVREAGTLAVKQVGAYLISPEFMIFLKQESTVRFYAIITALLTFVFLFIPRVDFFLSATEFLMVCILFFYLEDFRILVKLFGFYAGQVLVFLIYILTPIHTIASGYLPYPADILMLLFIISFAIFARGCCRYREIDKKKYKTGIILAMSAPFIVGICFKYFLLVPMPFEGMVIALLDYVWYL
jgi:hypothetical protein